MYETVHLCSMKKIAFILIVFVVVQAHGQTEKSVESKITDVTVFLSKAQVTREAKTRIESGRTLLRLSGLTAQLDPQSIQVAGKGNFTILGISHELDFVNEFDSPKKLTALKDSVEWVQRQIGLENSQKEILNKEELMLQSNQKIGGTSQNLSVAELRQMADFYRNRLTEIVTARMNHDIKIQRLNGLLVRLQRQVNSENELYLRNTSEIVISVAAEASVSADLMVQYVVNNAGWNPIYDLRAINTRMPVQLNYKANVIQQTGEEWKNVKLTLSTANPTLGGLKPELATWYLDFYQPHGYLKGKVAGVNSRAKRSVAAPSYAADSEVTEAKEEEASPSIADYVNTIQTSLNTEFQISLPYTVASSTKPTLVDIRNHEMKADYIYSAAPKLDNDAFLLAQATGWEEFSLLPGEANIFFEGTFVGKTFIDPNNVKDTLSVSLGRDKRIVIKREKVKDLTSRKVIGTSQRENRAFEISVRNTKNEPIKIRIEDQIPVTQNTQIEVTVIDVGGAAYTKSTGKLVWELTLQPNETKKVGFKYEVKYPKERVVSGLD